MKEKVSKAKKSTRKPFANNKLSKVKVSKLRELFYMGGITPNAAANIAGVDYLTAKTYFTEFAEELTEEDEHTPWAVREAHARARHMESITKNIIEVQESLDYYKSRLKKLIKKEKDGKSVKLIEADRLVRDNRVILYELQTEYADLDSMLPTEILLQAELEKLLHDNKAKMLAEQ